MLIKRLVLCMYIFSNMGINAHPSSGRIFGGEPAEPGEFPYIVSIQEDVPDMGLHGHACGGSILNNQWILTAGHCITTLELENYQILAGTNRLDSNGFRYNVTKLIQHPDFDLLAIANDIALIKIDGEFNFTDTLASIEIGEVLGDETAVTAGWGYTEDIIIPNELQFIEMRTLSLNDCFALAEGSVFIDIFPPGPENVCTITPDKTGMCNGDSGGPLVYNNTVVGVTSYFLDTTCSSRYPDVYTRVTYYKDWIESTILTN